MNDPVDLGPTGGVVWSHPQEWSRRLTADGCIICQSGGPLDVIAKTPTVWITAEARAPLSGYVCIVARTHVVEPYDLSPDEQSRFWHDAMTVARAVASVVDPIKMNYEIHGNTLPHLHLHLFPRQADDPYVGGPVDPRTGSVLRSPKQIAALQAAIASALEQRGSVRIDP